MLNIVLAQLNPTVGALDGNRAKIREALAAAPADTDLIAFPEMMTTGYPPEDLVLRDGFMAKVRKSIETLCQETASHSAALIVPTPWRDEDGQNYNAALIIERGEITAIIRKHHLPNYGVFDEERLFKSGALTDMKPVSIRGIQIGILICEDMWFPDVAAHLKNQGAELLISVNASPYDTDKAAKRLTQATERRAETDLPLLYLNQVGGQDELVFDGHSFALSESGNMVAQGLQFTEELIAMRWQRASAGHFLCDTNHNTQPASEAETIYRALVTGLRDYLTKNGFSGVLIGLSGGIDSALSAAIAVDALGADAVHCVMMPSAYTSDESLRDAEACAKALGVHLDTVPIKDAVAGFEQILAPHFTAETPAITHENIQSRCRGLILMALSNAVGRMVLSTGNKSEMAVGYATLYGDMCGGFNVLKDVYKMQVYELSRWRNQNHPTGSFGPQGVVIPENILTKAPSAELEPDQKDQDSLPPYETLDDILCGLIEDSLPLEDIIARGHDKATIERVWRLLDLAEYKRRQAPPGVKITTRAFGRERRYPITNRYGKR